ncbi:hypothetical protein TRFO_10124 [Tritrichomonas foetus]|uniref:Uncharacterized protein n=1 Tax=Tritrichomonas foetus TaxID=1144522 RepID=A0A1J4JC09_9EUKA|nr:hypothetical protein TRFO_10124 [Tritrichomonas foetus]|eukprot:OHS96193.1 hypothetical protein TRFO_10124 [Tritrichomonas foetus]
MSITTRSKRNLDLASKSTAPTVGPGSYETNDNGIVMKDDSPYPFLTTAARFKDNPNGNPGPADYHPEIPQLNIKCMGVKSMRSVTPRKSWDIIDSPDPCLYQQINDWDQHGLVNGQRRPRMPFSSRSPRDFGVFGRPDHENSPGDYNLRPGYEKGVQIPKSSRPIFKPNGNPGPGAYEVSRGRAPRNKLPSHQFLTSGERNIFPVSDSIADRPGLGHDDWALPKGFAPFGSKARKQNFWADKKKTPGPGAYRPEKDRSFSPNSAPFGVRGPRNWQEPNDNPGPGSYKLDGKRKFKDNPDLPFNQRSARKPFWGGGNPVGPGAYDVDRQDQVKALRKLESPSPSFLTGGDRNPFKGDPTVPGPGKYSPEKGHSQSEQHKLRRCIDGSERYKEGTFIGQPINDAPGPATYNPEREPTKRPGDPGGYWPHSKRGSWIRNTCAPSMEKYNVAGDLLKPSLNVTYSVCKL